MVPLLVHTFYEAQAMVHSLVHTFFEAQAMVLSLVHTFYAGRVYGTQFGTYLLCGLSF